MSWKNTDTNSTLVSVFRIVDDKILNNAYLSCKEAMELWSLGKDPWNQWVMNNPDASISFEQADFSTIDNNEIDFKHFTFPSGELSFIDAIFSDKIVNFSFSKINCKKILLSRKDFRGQLLFVSCIFDSTDIDLSYSKFSSGIAFFDSKLECSNINFRGSEFYSSNVFFWGVDLSTCFIEFRDSNINKSNFDFQFSILNSITFDRSTLSESDINFKAAHFKEYAEFSNLKIVKSMKSLSFRHARFDKGIDLSSDTPLGVIPDLIGSKIDGHFTFNPNILSLERTRGKLFLKSINIEDGDNLCRLREISESNKNHQLSLKLFQMEMQAKRWHTHNFGAGLLDATYDLMCNYGQSIIKPMICLLLVISMFVLYLIQGHPDHIQEAILLSISKAIPFISGSKDVGDSVKHIFLDKNTSVFPIIYSIICFSLLFLVGLGIRNRFRL